MNAHSLTLIALAAFSISQDKPAPPASQYGLELSRHDGFRVTGLSAAERKALGEVRWTADEWNKLLVVRVMGAKDGQENAWPPVKGAVRVRGDHLWFEPRFPLEPGIRYRVAFDPRAIPGNAASKAEPIAADFSLKKPATVPTTVTQVYPTATVLPENQLKFYLHFSAPMARGEAYSHVHLHDAAGKEIDLPFLELGEELWDPTGKRFTLFFDPGRIKRGLKPREEAGPALEEGKSYALVIDKDWPDANRNPLKEPYHKRFRVGPPEDRQVDVKSWKLAQPPGGTTRPLAVTFPRPMDHALLERLLRVEDAAGRAVEGRVETSAEETRWQFTPAKPWQTGEYRLTVGTALEDLAGNSIAKPFEVDVFRKVEQKVEAETVVLPFRVDSQR